jgi:chorismate lyase/3-hydroxybenzoate synthase
MSSTTLPDKRHYEAVEKNLIVPLGNDTESLHELFRFRFGTPAIQDTASINVKLTPATNQPVETVWLTGSPVKTRQSGRLQFAECDDFQFVTCNIDLTEQDISTAVEAAYSEILTATATNDYPHAARAWNYFPEINRGAGDLELYRQFAVGRADAFKKAGISVPNVPAATTIGTRTDQLLQIIVLFSKTSATNIENERQTSAYHYPREYGPVSPAFSRASLIKHAAANLLFVSGTASIVGSESQHTGDFDKQLQETIANLQALVSKSGWNRDSRCKSIAPLFTVYIRNDADLKATESSIRETFGMDSRVFFLHGDICRSELLIEIEGIFWFQQDEMQTSR